MRRLIWPVLFLFLILLQGAVSVFVPGWVSADLSLLLVYCYALLRGKDKGFIAGGLVGLVQDSLTVGMFGYHILTRAGLGFIVGTMNKKIFKEQFQMHVAIIGCISLVVRFIYGGLELINNNGNWDIISLYCWQSLGYCLGNMLLIIPMLKVCIFVFEWIKEKDTTY